MDVDEDVQQILDTLQFTDDAESTRPVDERAVPYFRYEDAAYHYPQDQRQSSMTTGATPYHDISSFPQEGFFQDHQAEWTDQAPFYGAAESTQRHSSQAPGYSRQITPQTRSPVEWSAIYRGNLNSQRFSPYPGQTWYNDWPTTHRYPDHFAANYTHYRPDTSQNGTVASNSSSNFSLPHADARTSDLTSGGTIAHQEGKFGSAHQILEGSSHATTATSLRKPRASTRRPARASVQRIYRLPSNAGPEQIQEYRENKFADLYGGAESLSLGPQPKSVWASTVFILQDDNSSYFGGDIENRFDKKFVELSTHSLPSGGTYYEAKAKVLPGHPDPRLVGELSGDHKEVKWMVSSAAPAFDDGRFTALMWCTKDPIEQDQKPGDDLNVTSIPCPDSSRDHQEVTSQNIRLSLKPGGREFCGRLAIDAGRSGECLTRCFGHIEKQRRQSKKYKDNAQRPAATDDSSCTDADDSEWMNDLIDG